MIRRKFYGSDEESKKWAEKTLLSDYSKRDTLNVYEAIDLIIMWNENFENTNLSFRLGKVDNNELFYNIIIYNKKTGKESSISIDNYDEMI